MDRFITLISRCSSRRETQLPILPLSDLDSSFRNKLSNFYWKVRRSRVEYSSGSLTSPSYRSRSDRLAKGKRILPVDAGSSLAAREIVIRQDFSRAPLSHSLDALPFSTLSSARLVHARPRTSRSVTIPCPLTGHRLVRTCVHLCMCISRPVINKSIALLSRTAGARSTCSTFMTERGREPWASKRGCGWGRREMLFTVSRIGKSVVLPFVTTARSLLRSRARSERLFSLETRSSRTIVVWRAPGIVFLSFDWFICAECFYLLSLPIVSITCQESETY